MIQETRVYGYLIQYKIYWNTLDSQVFIFKVESVEITTCIILHYLFTI